MRQLKGKELDIALIEWDAGKRTRAPQGTPLHRYMAHFTRKTDGCWIWAGNVSHGYGKFRLEHKNHYAHRVAFAMANGAIPKDAVVDHMCRNTLCVNPDHLQSVSRQENNENRPSEGYGSTGVRGVSWSKRRSKYEAYAIFHNRKYSAGYHSSLGDAEKAARALRMRLHTNNLADFESATRRSDVRAA